MKHTPGPWLKMGTTVYALNEHGSNRFQAQVTKGHIKEPSSPKTWIGDEESEANAKLIAAAPDLLAALRDLANDVEKVAKDSFWSGRFGTFDDDFATEDPYGYMAWKNAMDAIRKAEGN